MSTAAVGCLCVVVWGGASLPRRPAVGGWCCVWLFRRCRRLLLAAGGAAARHLRSVDVSGVALDAGWWSSLGVARQRRTRQAAHARRSRQRSPQHGTLPGAQSPPTGGCRGSDAHGFGRGPRRGQQRWSTWAASRRSWSWMVPRWAVLMVPPRMPQTGAHWDAGGRRPKTEPSSCRCLRRAQRRASCGHLQWVSHRA